MSQPCNCRSLLAVVHGSSSDQEVPIDELDALTVNITPGWQGCSARLEDRDIPRVRGTQDVISPNDLGEVIRKLESIFWSIKYANEHLANAR